MVCVGEAKVSGVLGPDGLSAGILGKEGNSEGGGLSGSRKGYFQL